MCVCTVERWKNLVGRARRGSTDLYAACCDQSEVKAETTRKVENGGVRACCREELQLYLKYSAKLSTNCEPW